MRTFGLVLALLVVGSGVCVADSVTVDLYNSYNYITCPLVPFNPDPLSVFSGVDIDYRLNRFDAPSQGWVVYDSIDPSGFGNILLGDGFQLDNYANVDNFVYSGVPDGVPDGQGPAGHYRTDMWVSMPGNQLDAGSAGGMHLFGHPFNHDTPVNGALGTGDNVWFTDGTTLKTWDEAQSATWVDSLASYWNPVGMGWDSLDYTGLGSDDHLRKGVAYILYTKVDNLAMIIPAYDAENPRP